MAQNNTSDYSLGSPTQQYPSDSMGAIDPYSQQAMWQAAQNADRSTPGDYSSLTPDMMNSSAASSPAASAASSSGGGLGDLFSGMDTGEALGGAAGLLGNQLALNSTNAAANVNNQAYQGAMGNYQNIMNMMNPGNLQEQLQQAQMTNYSPAVLQATPQVAPSAYQNLGPNQQVMAQQQANNAALQGVSQSGYTPEMMAAYQGMLNNNNSNLQSQIAGIQQQQAARGMGSGGAALAMQQNAAQNATNAANTSTNNIAAQGFQNKLAAMGQLGSLTNAQQSQLSALAATQAQGMQQNSQYGTTLQADIAAQNIARQQQQANAQTQAANQFSQFNTGIANQQNYQNQVGSKLQSANAQQAAAGGVANVTNQAAANRTGQGASQGAGALGQVAGVADILSSFL